MLWLYNPKNPLLHALAVSARSGKSDTAILVMLFGQPHKDTIRHFVWIEQLSIYVCSEFQSVPFEECEFLLQVKGNVAVLRDYFWNFHPVM